MISSRSMWLPSMISGVGNQLLRGAPPVVDPLVSLVLLQDLRKWFEERRICILQKKKKENSLLENSIPSIVSNTIFLLRNLTITTRRGKSLSPPCCYELGHVCASWRSWTSSFSSLGTSVFPSRDTTGICCVFLKSTIFIIFVFQIFRATSIHWIFYPKMLAASLEIPRISLKSREMFKKTLLIIIFLSKTKIFLQKLRFFLISMRGNLILFSIICNVTELSIFRS